MSVLWYVALTRVADFIFYAAVRQEDKQELQRAFRFREFVAEVDSVHEEVLFSATGFDAQCNKTGENYLRALAKRVSSDTSLDAQKELEMLCAA